MVRPSWLRVPALCVVVLLALTGCSFGRAEGATTPGAAGTASPTPDSRRVSLVQRLGDGPVRNLDVDPSGRWQCRDCAGDGVDATGTLNPDQTRRLQRMLADPAMAKETDQARGYKQGCIGVLTSTLLVPPDLTVTIQDCPGEPKPKVAYDVLLLVTQATPAEDKG
ncbi:hypothetical protein J5U46_26230 [Micromonospora tulbaghiae]|uniref:Uncharacterized protein n=1 Tax=Micromonospora tulbaghiae TaxID=479978 RepID=A0AAW4JNP5_9ACTN|nr:MULTISPECIES: hypothetical protein [Micromonospora]KAB1902818.1 hypothetical protein F8279_24860 [Micromonospora sp. AMSO1212t]MBO4143648.1 hypothetical protein [Micromonospora tulbaghiae]